MASLWHKAWSHAHLISPPDSEDRIISSAQRHIGRAHRSFAYAHWRVSLRWLQVMLEHSPPTIRSLLSEATGSKIGRIFLWLHQVRMTQTSKIERYKHYMAAKGVGEATAFPPAWHVLWSIGVRVPPPPFLGFASLALITGGFFGPLFGLCVWLLGNRGLRGMADNEAVWVALISGAFFGLSMAAYYRHMAHKHRLGSWAAFSATPLRT